MVKVQSNSWDAFHSYKLSLSSARNWRSRSLNEDLLNPLSFWQTNEMKSEGIFSFIQHGRQSETGHWLENYKHLWPSLTNFLLVSFFFLLLFNFRPKSNYFNIDSKYRELKFKFETLWQFITRFPKPKATKDKK